MNQSQNWQKARDDMEDLQRFKEKMQALKTAVANKQAEIAETKQLEVEIEQLTAKLASKELQSMQKDVDNFKKISSKKASSEKDPALANFETDTLLDEIINGGKLYGSLLNPIVFSRINSLRND
jgi:hypothetical protein